MHRAVGGGGTGCRAAASIPPRPSPTPDRGQSSNRRSSDPKGEKGAGRRRDDDKIAGTLFCWPGKIPQIFAFARPVISPRSASGFVKTSQATVNPARPNPPLVFFFLSYPPRFRSVAIAAFGIDIRAGPIDKRPSEKGRSSRKEAYPLSIAAGPHRSLPTRGALPTKNKGGIGGLLGCESKESPPPHPLRNPPPRPPPTPTPLHNCKQ